MLQVHGIKLLTNPYNAQKNPTTSNITWKKEKLLFSVIIRKVMKTLKKIKFKVNTTATQTSAFLPYVSMVEQMGRK